MMLDYLVPGLFSTYQCFEFKILEDYLVTGIWVINILTNFKSSWQRWYQNNSRKSRNSFCINSIVVVWEYMDSWLGVHLCPVLEPDTTLTKCFTCHIYCAQLVAPRGKIVGTSRTVLGARQVFRSRRAPQDVFFSRCFSTYSAAVEGFLDCFPGICEIGRFPLDVSGIGHS